MKLQIEWINTLKFIGILAVILGHINSPFGAFIFSWHMPLFFIIAGFFIRYEASIKDFIVKDFSRLMIPYFIFAFLGLFLVFIKRLILGLPPLDIYSEIFGIIFKMDQSSLINHYGFVLWFLPALFFAKLIFLLLHKVTSNTVIITLVTIFLFILSFYIDLPFGIDNACNGLLWILIGKQLFSIKSSKYLLYFPIFFILLFITFDIPVLNISDKVYDKNIILNIFWAVSFIGSLIYLLQKIKVQENLLKIITLWGSNTMLLFIIHPYTNNIAYLIEGIYPNLWYAKFSISLLLLYILLNIKIYFDKYSRKWIKILD